MSKGLRDSAAEFQRKARAAVSDVDLWSQKNRLDALIKRLRRENERRDGKRRMDKLRREAGGLSPKVAAERLRKLERLKAESALRGDRLVPTDFTAFFVKGKSSK